MDNDASAYYCMSTYDRLVDLLGAVWGVELGWTEWSSVGLTARVYHMSGEVLGREEVDREILWSDYATVYRKETGVHRVVWGSSTY